MLRLGVIGLGNRASAVLKAISEVAADMRLVGVVDPEPGWVKKRLEKVKVSDDYVRFYDDVPAMLAQGNLDGCLIGTRCYLHTPMALQVAEAGIPLFLEKPVAIDKQQLQALARAYAGREDQVVVSFPLRVSPLFQAAMQIIDSGRLGTITQIQAVNYVTYGGCYFGQWHRNYEESGGLWLQKATHDLDCVNLLAGSVPTCVAAMESHRIYHGDKPHDLKCSACDETRTCPESVLNQQARGDSGSMRQEHRVDFSEDHWCCFSREQHNQDAGSVLVRYANGLHASYTQNFVVRRDTARHGARVVGHQATLDFDWHTRQIRVVDHHGQERVDEISVNHVGTHMGGDLVLMRNFVELMRGEATASISDLHAGLASAALCLAARESAKNNTFESVMTVGHLLETGA